MLTFPLQKMNKIFYLLTKFLLALRHMGAITLYNHVVYARKLQSI